MNAVSRPNKAQSVALAIAMLVALALALGLVAAHPAMAQAKTKYVKVSVLVKAVSESQSGTSDYRNEAIYQYNKNGLLKKCDENSVSGGGSGGVGVGAAGVMCADFKYSKGKLERIETNGGDTTIFRNKKGRISKILFEGSNEQAVTYKYNKKNQPVKLSWYFKSYINNKVTSRATSTVKYNKKGLVSKVVTKGSERLDGTQTYAYDSKGMLKTVVDKGKSKTAYKNAYRGKKLVKQTATTKYDSGEDKRVTTTTYKYKTVKVPEKYVDQVKEQQAGFFKVKPAVEEMVLP